MQDFHNKQQKHSNYNNATSKTQNSADSQAESERYCSFHGTTTHWERDCRALALKKNRPNRFSETYVLQELPESLETDEEWDEHVATPLALIGIIDSNGNSVPSVGDCGCSVCLVSQSAVQENHLRVCLFNTPRPNKVMGKDNKVFAKGLVKFPVWYEQHQITILARVLEDKDMPSGKKLLIGNNHQLQRQTLIDLREMLYYTTADDGTHIAIPCSAGEFKFQESSFHICAFEDINLPPESSQSVQITFQTTGNEQTFDFPKPTLLLVEKYESTNIYSKRNYSSRRRIPYVCYSLQHISEPTTNCKRRTNCLCISMFRTSVLDSRCTNI